MSEDNKLDELWKKIKSNQEAYDRKLKEGLSGSVSWSAAARLDSEEPTVTDFSSATIGFIGKNLENGRFANENLSGANFSVANLTNVDFSNANLTNVDFSGANLSGANLSGADLSGAVLSGAVLHKTNFTGAKMHGVKLVDADLEDAILLDIDIDNIGLEELQSLIEYIAKYYPHKLNLTKINLTLLNLSQIDLRGVNLRGVDFTGCDMTGVNIAELDLSECIITPQQIAQALGRVPSREELAKILAPKNKAKSNFKGVDFTSLFLDDGRAWGITDTIRDKGISIDQLIKVGKKVFGHGKKPKVKDEDALNDVKQHQEVQAKSHNEELRKVIEERKQQELTARRQMKEKIIQQNSQMAQNEPKVQTRAAPVNTKTKKKTPQERPLINQEKGRDR